MAVSVRKQRVAHCSKSLPRSVGVLRTEGWHGKSQGEMGKVWGRERLRSVAYQKESTLPLDDDCDKNSRGTLASRRFREWTGIE